MALGFPGSTWPFRVMPQLFRIFSRSLSTLRPPIPLICLRIFLSTSLSFFFHRYQLFSPRGQCLFFFRGPFFLFFFPPPLPVPEVFFSPPACLLPTLSIFLSLRSNFVVPLFPRPAPLQALHRRIHLLYRSSFIRCAQISVLRSFSLFLFGLR